uniref:Reverse transcriptase domain-containing protein n=1 Tax=Fagus sylvatica TaxID=28930 RepID=A0A2N9I5I3_FAGSY
MDDISGLWETFSLNDNEVAPFDFGSTEDDNHFYLAARFMTTRVLNIESIVRTFRPLWRTFKGFSAQDMGNNMVVFTFEDEADMARVLQSEPWSYDKHLVSFQRVEADMAIEEMECRCVSFWVQMYNLPVRQMNKEAIIALAEKDCVMWLRSKGTLRRDTQQYGAWLRAPMDKPIKRVEVRAECRSNVPRWGQPQPTPFGPSTEGSPVPGASSGAPADKAGSSLGLDTSKETTMQSPEIIRSSVDNLEQHLLEIDLALKSPLSSRLAGNKGFDQSTPLEHDVLGNSQDPEQNVMVYGLKRKEVVMVKLRREEVLTALQGNLWMGIWRRLVLNPASPNEHLKLELLGAWEPDGRSCSSQLGEVPSRGSSGGLALLWNDSVELTIQNYTQNHIDAHVQVLPSQLWRFIGFYGHSEDFNEILSVDERMGEVLGMYGRMEDFNEVVNRLDHALATASWLECFNLSSVSHVLCFHSNHVPLLLQMDVSSSCHRPKWHPRKFEEKWALHPKCEVIVKEVWADDALQGSPMYIVCEKIKMCCERLFNWYKGISGEFHGLIRDKTQSLVHLVEDNVSGVNNSAIAATKSEINRLLLSEELHWRQCSRMTWLAAAVDYFERLFASSQPTQINETLMAVDSTVSQDANRKLLLPFSVDEVRVALFQMHPSKAPGTDGMTSFFFQKFWHVIGPSVSTAVLSVLNSARILRKINLTHISPIPKKKNPEHMSDYRPISLCNVIYKIISKVLANRLKTVLPLIISYSQSAFVPGRLITDNVSVAFEIVHKLKGKRKGKKGEMALKLDMSKAYDRVEWDFLEAIMRKLGFDDQWVSVIMSCVRTVQYSVLLDGVPKGYIIPSRGIRQGDPLSPYLFLLCAEGLSALLRQASISGRLRGIQTSHGGPWVSHLFFADDSLFFSHATIADSERFMDILNLAGREILIKAVAQAIPTYAMNCFKLPKTWCEEINSLIARYWWGQKNEERKLHWIRWDKLCTAKPDGGLGFRNLHMFNMALLANQSWRLLQNPQSLFYRVFKARYFPNCSIMEATLGNNPSFLWRSILSGREVILKGLSWQNSDNGRTPLPIWLRLKTGSFTVQSAYVLLESEKRGSFSGECSNVQGLCWFWKKTWKLAIPRKIKHFLWRAYHEFLPTFFNLYWCKINSNPYSVICKQDEDTTIHALWQCPLARNTWALVQGRVQKIPNQAEEFSGFMQWIFRNFTSDALAEWAAVVWSIWNARNKMVYEDCQLPPALILSNGLSIVRDFKHLYWRFQTGEDVTVFVEPIFCFSIFCLANEYGPTRA